MAKGLSWSFLFKYVWPPSVLTGVCSLFGEWQRGDAKNKILVGIFFIPALLSLGGLLLCVAYFVLFKLPSFILEVLGWLLLASLFSGGGLFCCEKLTNAASRPHGAGGGTSADPEVVEEPAAPKWWGGVRNVKWPR
jgi:hypothetical protein